MQRFPVADAHCDLLYKRFYGLSDRCVTRAALERGGVRAQVLAAFVNSAKAGADTAAHYRAQIADFPAAAEELGLVPLGPGEALCPDGPPRAIAAIEGGEALGGSLEVLSGYLAGGVRILTLVWNHENELGYPHGAVGGLKSPARGVIAMLARHGAALDVSHLSRRGFWQAAELGVPLMASHSCASALCAHSRNLTDDQIRAIIALKGFIGINFYPAFISSAGRADIRGVVAHAMHILRLGGQDALGFGSDFDGIDVAPVGLESPAHFPSLLASLAREGLPDALLRKIAFGNFAAFLSRVGGAAS